MSLPNGQPIKLTPYTTAIHMRAKFISDGMVMKYLSPYRGPEKMKNAGMFEMSKYAGINNKAPPPQNHEDAFIPTLLLLMNNVHKNQRRIKTREESS
ncbi:hypothetical protein [Paenibacillus turpanensis]|uniref:hypothetical protein n=1 Tax=Paenibacillus turpanensis TaxID=2689078 RepID=UPI0014076E9A|nr:hypothetical protein [Paenibacillus turpanensis]